MKVASLEQQLSIVTDNFKIEKQTREAFEPKLNQYETDNQKLIDENKQLRVKIIWFEKKYRYIDIDKLHEKINYYECKEQAMEGKLQELLRESEVRRDERNSLYDSKFY